MPLRFPQPSKGGGNDAKEGAPVKCYLNLASLLLCLLTGLVASSQAGAQDVPLSGSNLGAQEAAIAAEGSGQSGPLYLKSKALLSDALGSPLSSASEVDQYRAVSQVIKDDGERSEAGALDLAAKPKRSSPALVRGTDQTVKLPESRRMISEGGEGVALKFEQAPVTEVVHAVLGDLLKLDYAIVGPLSGEITLHTQAPVPKEQLLVIIESLLLNNGIVMVQDVNGRYRVGKSEVLKTAVPLPRRVDDKAAGFGSVIVPLRNIGALEMADILRPVAGGDALVRVDSLRNLLVLAGGRSQIEGWLQIIETFDVDLLKGMSFGLFPLENGSVKEIEQALKALFASGDASASTGGRPASAGGAKADESTVTAVKLAGPLGGLVRVLAIERLNALLVITPRVEFLEKAKLWIEKLDRPMDSDGEPQLYVYPVQNGSALHLANLLNGLYAPVATGAGGGGASTGVAPTLQTQVQGAVPMAGSLSSGSIAGGAAPRAAATASPAPVTQVSLGKDIRVVADNHNNALLIHAPKRDYKRIVSALRQLDVTPNQVLIEASIVEVTLTDETKYGLQWYFEGGLGRGGWKGSGVLRNSTSAGIDAVQQGFSYTVTNPLGDVRAVLNAMADKQLVNVISSPSVMVLDNQTAWIQVGDQQPIRSSTTVTDGGTSTSSIQYKDTGVSLSVTPSVNAGNLITMQINQSVADVGQIDAATGQRSFLQRQITSKVAVRSGEAVVLGGLIRDNKGNGRQGVPLLQDIPFIGSLFSTTTLKKDRTELLVMITPRIMRNEQDVREVGAELRSKMTGIKIR